MVVGTKLLDEGRGDSAKFLNWYKNNTPISWRWITNINNNNKEQFQITFQEQTSHL